MLFYILNLLLLSTSWKVHEMTLKMSSYTEKHHNAGK